MGIGDSVSPGYAAFNSSRHQLSGIAHSRIENTLGDPVEFLYTEHASIVDWCHRLATLADDPTAVDAPRVAASLLEFLDETLPRHIADEEEELFPRLKQRAPQDERLMSVIEQLQMEHREDIEQGQALHDSLEGLAYGRAISEPVLFAAFVRIFTMLQRRHQTLENNVVLPAAFEYLDVNDRKALAHSMLARRAAG